MIMVRNSIGKICCDYQLLTSKHSAVEVTAAGGGGGEYITHSATKTLRTKK